MGTPRSSVPDAARMRSACASATCSSRHVASDARELTESAAHDEPFLEYDAAAEVAEYTVYQIEVDANLSSTIFNQGRREIYRYKVSSCVESASRMAQDEGERTEMTAQRSHHAQ